MLQSRSSIILIVGVLVSYGIIVVSKPIKSSTDTVTLSANETTKICCDAKLQVNSIQDSRCPAKVTCIWAGQAKVQLHLSNMVASTAVELIIGAQPKPNTLVTVGSKMYNVTLENVIPYPGTSNNVPQAVLQIVCL